MSRAGNSYNPMAAKRIKKEIVDIAKEDLGDIQMVPSDANIFQWKATIPGPVGSPYEGGVFHVDIHLPPDYPFSPPKLQFATKVYHCNINQDGGICLDLLKNAWSPALSLYKVILSLSSLLTDPNPKDPLVPAIARQYNSNRQLHDSTAREWVRLHAMPKGDSSATTTAKPKAVSAVRPGLSRTATGSSTSSRPRPSPQPPAIPASVPTRRPAQSDDVIDLRDSDDDDGIMVESATRSVKRLRKTNGDAAPSGSSTRRTNGGGSAAPPSSDVIVID